MFVTYKQHGLPGPHMRSFALLLNTVLLKSVYGFSEVTMFIRKRQFFEISPAGGKVQVFINWVNKIWGRNYVVMLPELNIFKIRHSFSTGIPFGFQHLCLKRFKIFRSSDGKSGFRNQCNNISNLPYYFSPIEFRFTIFGKLRVFVTLQEEEILQNQTFTEPKTASDFSVNCLLRYCKPGTLLKWSLVRPLPTTLPIFWTSACV